MNYKIPFAGRCLPALAVLVALFAQTGHAASLTIGFSVAQLGANGSDPSYQIQISPLPSQVSQITAPDGSAYTRQSLQLTPPTVATFADVGAHFFGTWTINDQNGSGPVSQYQFTLSPFTLDAVFHEVPSIVSPLDGATVNNPFDVNWAFPSGANLSAITISLQGAQASFTPGQMDYTVHVNSALPVQGQVRAGTFSSISSYLSSITPVGQPGPDSFSYFVPAFRDLSPPITVNVVPEPDSRLLAVIGAIFLATCFKWSRQAQAI